MANVGGFGFGDPVVSAVAETLAHAFGRGVLVLRVPRSRNYTLVVRRDAEPPRPDAEGWRVEGPLQALLVPRELEGGWLVMEPPARAPLTDDRNRIEQLQLASLREGRDRLHGDR